MTLPKSNAEVLFNVLKHKSGVICLTQKIFVLDTLCLSMSQNTYDYELRVSESTTQSREDVFKQKLHENKFIYWLTKIKYKKANRTSNTENLVQNVLIQCSWQLERTELCGIRID